MADATLGSRVVFQARAIELGMSQDAVVKAILEGIGTMGGFGFSTKFSPGFIRPYEASLKGLTRLYNRPSWAIEMAFEKNRPGKRSTP